MNEGTLLFYVSAECPACGEEVRCKSVLATEVKHGDKPVIPAMMIENLAFRCECGEIFETGELYIA
jgi:hypothetical protein